MEDGRCLRTLSGHTGHVTGLAVGPDGTLCSSSKDQTVRVWSGIEYSHLKTFIGHSAAVWCVQATRGDLVFSGSEDATVKVWKRGATPNACIRSLKGHVNTVRHLALSPDHTALYSGSDDATINVWSVSDFSLMRKFDCVCRVTDLVVGIDGSLVVSCGVFQIRRGSDGQVLHEIGGNYPLCLAPGPGNTVLSGERLDGFALGMWSTQTGALRDTIPGTIPWGVAGDDVAVCALACGPDGKVYTGGFGDDYIHVW
eukprot:m.327668 g.327668  ORF g.327668 m.327668 type:complete len:255 (+) comp16496_c0_seq2:504-1268(+)